MQNRDKRSFRRAPMAIGAAVAALGLTFLATSSAEAHPDSRRVPAPPAVSAHVVVRPFVRFPTLPAVQVVTTPRPYFVPQPIRYIPAPPVVAAPMDIYAEARARLAKMRRELGLSDRESAMLEPMFVQAAQRARAIRAQGPMTMRRARAIQLVWQRLDNRVQALLTSSQRGTWRRFHTQRVAQGWYGHRDGRDWRDDGDGRDGRDDRDGSDGWRDGRDGRDDRDGRDGDGRDGSDDRDDSDSRDGRDGHDDGGFGDRDHDHDGRDGR